MVSEINSEVQYPQDQHPQDEKIARANLLRVYALIDDSFLETYPGLYKAIYDSFHDPAFLTQIENHKNDPNAVIDITLEKCRERDGAMYNLDRRLSQDENFANSIKTIDPFQAKRLIDGIESSSDKLVDLLRIDRLINYVVTILRTQSTDPTIQDLFVQTAKDCKMTTESFNGVFRDHLNTWVNDFQKSQTNSEQGR